MKYQKSAKITLWAVRFFMLCLLILSVAAPWIARWYTGFRHLGGVSCSLLLVTYYVCVPAAGYALWAMQTLLQHILCGEVFTRGNVRLVRGISLCCAIVAITTTLGTINYQPFVFVAVIMSFLFLVVRVVAHVLEAATEIREENDLTI